MKIFIKKLEFDAIIGLLDFERETPQRVLVDCEIEYDGEYVDYSKVREFIINSVKEKGFLLIEDALVFLAQGIKSGFSSIKRVKLEMFKPDIFGDCVVGAGYELQV